MKKGALPKESHDHAKTWRGFTESTNFIGKIPPRNRIPNLNSDMRQVFVNSSNFASLFCFVFVWIISTLYYMNENRHQVMEYSWR